MLDDPSDRRRIERVRQDQLTAFGQTTEEPPRFCTAKIKPSIHLLCNFRRKEDFSFLIPFADDSERTRGPFQVLHSQSRHFRAAQSAAEQKRNQCAVANRFRSGVLIDRSQKLLRLIGLKRAASWFPVNPKLFDGFNFSVRRQVDLSKPPGRFRHPFERREICID